MMYHLPEPRAIDSNEELSVFGEVLMKLAHRRGIETLPEIGAAVEGKGFRFIFEELVGLVYGRAGISPYPGALAAVRDALDLTDEEDAVLRGAVLEYLYAEPEPLEETD